MMWLRAKGPVVVASLLALFGANPARADVCAGSDLALDAELARRLPELRAHVREALEKQHNLDPCARIRLTSRGSAIAVDVQLADGRATERTVTLESDVAPTLAALLVLPQALDDARTSPLDRAAPPSEALSRTEPTAARAASAQPPAALAANALRSRGSQRDRVSAAGVEQHSGPSVELAGVTGARIGDGQVSLGLGALSLLEISSWLAGFSARADRYHALGPGDSSSSALELALLAGHRFRGVNTAFDLIAGLAIIPQGSSTYAEEGPLGRMATESSSSTVGRLVLGARASFFARATLRPLLGIDAEFGPARSETTRVPNAPRLPLWTLGLSTGVSLGT